MKTILSLIVTLFCVNLMAGGLNRPESVTYDFRTDTYYVSNTGDGSIIASPDLKTWSTVLKDKGAVRGLFINKRTLYAASEKGLLVYDLDSNSLLKTVPIPGSVFLNDVTIDGQGNVYITDNKASKIFKYSPASGTVSTFLSRGIQNPNGIIFDASNNRLLLVSLRPNSPIQEISLPEGKLSIYKSTDKGNLDGLGMDSTGQIYFSSWQSNAIYRLKDQNSEPVLMWGGLSGAADFFTWISGGKLWLLIPEMTANRILTREVK